jgi:hypothetical protein
MMRTWVLMALVFVGLSTGLGMTQAQPMRDPTVAPDAASAGGTASGLASGGASVGGQGDQGGGRAFTIIIRNGKPSLVVGTRLYVQGQKLGGETIDRITETEVWLRTGRVVRKVPQFPGIERHAPLEPAACKPNKKNAPRVASCANVQP